MKQSFRLFVLVFLAVALAAAGLAVAQPQTVTRRIPQFENEDVRVWKSIIAPKQPLTMHRHDHPRVIVALAGGMLKIVEEAGASKELTWETGRAYWLPADPPGQRHADLNETDAPIEVIVVELKGVH